MIFSRFFVSTENDRSVGIINQKVTILNSFLLCNFTRLKAIAGIEKFFNLSNPHYILVAYGKTNSLGKIFITDSKRCFIL